MRTGGEAASGVSETRGVLGGVGGPGEGGRGEGGPGEDDALPAEGLAGGVVSRVPCMAGWQGACIAGSSVAASSRRKSSAGAGSAGRSAA
jgi:hypothetical protein